MCEIIDGLMLVLLGIASWGDWKRREISVNLLIVMSVFVIGSAFLLKRNSLLSVLGGIAIGLVVVYLSYITEQKIGYGDSWLIGVLGVYLGGTALLELMLIASLAASVCSLGYCACHGWNPNHTLPFIPFMLVAFVGVLLF